MIEEIRIKNFQAHESAMYRLSPVTTFVGRSDKGKSAILRALRWVVTNTPRGNGFVREGQSTCKVGVKVDNRIVLRTRATSKNAYTLDGEELKAFGAGTPDVVDEVFAMSPASFQGQFDGPFWLTLSGGQLADKLNQIADLQLLTKMVSSAGKKVKENKTDLKAHESILENAKAEISFHEWAVDAKKDLENLDALYEQIRTKQQSAHSLQQQLHAVQDAQDVLRNPSVADAIKATETLRDAAQRVQQLQHSLHTLQDADLIAKKPSLEPAMEALEVIIQYRDNVQELHDLVQTVAQASAAVENATAIENELREQHSSIQLCPTCEQPLPCPSPSTK